MLYQKKDISQKILSYERLLLINYSLKNDLQLYSIKVTVAAFLLYKCATLSPIRHCMKKKMKTISLLESTLLKLLPLTLSCIML